MTTFILKDLLSNCHI